MTNEAQCVWDANRSLGEGPVFDEQERAVYWVDIEQPAILRYAIDSGDRHEFPMPEKIGCIAQRERGGFVAGLRSGFAFVDLDVNNPGCPRLQPICNPEPNRPGNRFNDGKCDGRGRFWAGTMDAAIERPTGALYRLDPDQSVQRMDEGYVVTNGPAWSPDGKTLYHNDTNARIVYAFDCEPDTGSIAGKRVFLRLAEKDGFPDGMTVDREGCVWLAHWGGFRVTRFTPEGQIDRTIKLPAAQVTSCAFGGSDLRTLYVTTALTGLTPTDLADQPLAGGLFAIDVDIAGMPANRFAG